ncbi:MAG: hypothetical protein IPI95_01910 [Flavobacteriales bacterium]|nr:hypothetical protein [Flavobacteriales bacterium]
MAKLRSTRPTRRRPLQQGAGRAESKAYRPTTSQTYIRAYELGANGRWNDISLAFSSM